jgi:hypothetical protein
MDLAEYHVDLSNLLSPVVSVNGEPIPGVRRVSLDCQNGDVPHLYLNLLPGSKEISGQGIVVQRIEIPDDGLEAMAQFLDGVDPSELEREALERFGAFSSESTGEAFLAVLKEWVRRGE